MAELQPVTERCLTIPEFDVFELGDGRWRAVHQQDGAVRFEMSDWYALSARCASARATRRLRLRWAEVPRRDLVAAGIERTPRDEVGQ